VERATILEAPEASGNRRRVRVLLETTGERPYAHVGAALVGLKCPLKEGDRVLVALPAHRFGGIEVVMFSGADPPFGGDEDTVLASRSKGNLCLYAGDGTVHLELEKGGDADFQADGTVVVRQGDGAVDYVALYTATHDDLVAAKNKINDLRTWASLAQAWMTEANNWFGSALKTVGPPVTIGSYEQAPPTPPAVLAYAGSQAAQNLKAEKG